MFHRGIGNDLQAPGTALKLESCYLQASPGRDERVAVTPTADFCRRRAPRAIGPCVAEMCAYGLPVVATPAAGNPEVVCSTGSLER